ncbi:MAG: APC family permease, partial [bacterium]
RRGARTRTLVQAVVSKAQLSGNSSSSAADPSSGGTYRVIGAVGATGMIVASMVGSGIFSLTGRYGASVATDENVLVAWTIGGILALCGGLSLAELGAMIPCSGGSVEFARRAFGKATGYLVAMVTILSGYFLSIAVVALLLAEYVNKLLPTPIDPHQIAVVVIVAAYVSQLANLRAGFAVNTVLSILKIGFCAAFVVVGLLWPVDERLAAPAIDAVGAANAIATPGMFSAPVASAVLAVSFAYLGWSTGADIAGDIRRPGRNVPLAICLSIAIVFLLYIGVNLVYLRVMAPGAMVEPDGSPMQAIGSVVATRLFGEPVGHAMSGVIALLFFSTIVAGTITAARILESMATAREIPGWVGVREPNGVPRRALDITVLASLAALLIGGLDDILGLLTVLVNIFSSLSVAALIVLRRTMPDATRPFRVPLYPFTPLLYLALAGWSIVASMFEGGLQAIIGSLATVAILLATKRLLAPSQADNQASNPTNHTNRTP